MQIFPGRLFLRYLSILRRLLEPNLHSRQTTRSKTGSHNSGWVRDPGDLIFQDSTLMNVLELYVKDVLTTFKDDERIAIWDLYSEPGNSS